MPLTQVVLKLARNPGFPDGDVQQGYVITAPLTPEGFLSEPAWRDHKRSCSVVRVRPGTADDADGRLTHRGGHWYIHYDEAREGDDEPIHRLGGHSLAVGEYISIREPEGERTYRVEQHLPLIKGAS
jgi:hypothetical protein